MPHAYSAVSCSKQATLAATRVTEGGAKMRAGFFMVKAWDILICWMDKLLSHQKNPNNNN